jgi:AraC-like DNA-binding protein
MFQISGETCLVQEERCCEVSEGEISLLDEARPFVLSGSRSGQIMFLRMPRQAVMRRHPQLSKNTAVCFAEDNPAAKYIHKALLNLLAVLPHLTDRQRGSALMGFGHLLGVLEPDPRGDSSSWRVKEALEFIELNFSNPDVRAADVASAQRISRRRLDSILFESTGLPITAQIWAQRLEQAAMDLRDPLRSHWSVSQVGYSNGFSSPAHFSRAFKERYGAGPLQFRGFQ